MESPITAGREGVKGTQGKPWGRLTHPELLGLQVLVAPLVLIVIHEGAIRGVLQGPGVGVGGKSKWGGSPGTFPEARA